MVDFDAVRALFARDGVRFAVYSHIHCEQHAKRDSSLPHGLGSLVFRDVLAFVLELLPVARYVDDACSQSNIAVASGLFGIARSPFFGALLGGAGIQLSAGGDILPIAYIVSHRKASSNIVVGGRAGQKQRDKSDRPAALTNELFDRLASVKAV